MLRARLLAFGACCALCAWPTPATAQCPQWTDSFRPDNGASSPVWALGAFDLGEGPRLIAGGDFTTIGPSAGDHLACWNGTSWSTVGGGTSGSVLGFASFDDGDGPALYVAGSFAHAGGVLVHNVARWDGTSWSPLGGGTNEAATALAVFDDGGGPDLYVGGLFNEVGDEFPARKIARWDGSQWSPLGSGLASAAVLSLVVFDDGRGEALFVSGLFTMAGAVPARNVARWDGTGWSALGAGLDGQASILAVHNDGSGAALYAGGFFEQAGAVPANGIARWNGSVWSAVGGGVTGHIRTLTTHTDASGAALIAAGRFTSAGGTPAENVARWDGTQWTALGGGVEGEVLASTSVPLDGPGLYLGGTFTSAGGETSKHIAEWADPCVAADNIAFCFGTDATCPCGNGGLGDRGCDIQQDTGGVRLDAPSFLPDGAGGGTVTFAGSGFPPNRRPTVVLIRGVQAEAPPVAFGDGLRCVGPTVRRMHARFALGGTSVHSTSHGGGAGRFFYQLWFRNTPAMYCDPTAAFNLSNGYILTW